MPRAETSDAGCGYRKHGKVGVSLAVQCGYAVRASAPAIPQSVMKRRHEVAGATVSATARCNGLANASGYFLSETVGPSCRSDIAQHRVRKPADALSSKEWSGRATAGPHQKH